MTREANMRTGAGRMVSTFLLAWMTMLCLVDGGEEWQGQSEGVDGDSGTCNSFSQKKHLDIARDSENLRSIVLRHNLRVRFLFC